MQFYSPCDSPSSSSSSSFSSSSSSSSSSSIGTTAHCGLWPVEQFFPICHQLSPSSHSQHLKISFYFLFPSFPGSSPSSRPFQFISFILPGFSMVCTFHVATVISVYLVSFRPPSFNLSRFFLCSTFVTISFFTGWGC